MTIVLKRWHWILFLALSLTQVAAFVLMARSSISIFTSDFLQHSGWFTRFMIPFFWAISGAFTDTVIIAKLTEVFTERRS